MLARFRKIAFLMAYAVATIPLWHYIRDGRILALMIIVIIFAYINVVLSTVDAAQSILTSEKAKIALPRWLPDKPKYHKWWMLVRHTLRWHLLLIPAKMGLALGFVEFLFLNELGSAFYLIHETYDYYSHNLGVVTANEVLPTLYPQWETLLFGFLSLAGFAIMNTGILGAIIIFASQRTSPEKIPLLVVLFCIFFGIAGLGISSLIRPIESRTYDPRHTGYFCRYAWGDEDLMTECRTRKRIGQSIYAALLTPLEHGILLSANIMRPMGKMTYDELGWFWYEDFTSWDNRPFVARQIVAGILGFLLYAGTTWVILWFVEDEPNVT